MNNSSNLFSVWVEEAMKEVANHGWKEASQNAVTLAAFGMIVNKIDRKVDRLVKPAWAIAVSIMGSAIWWIIRSIVGT